MQERKSIEEGAYIQFKYHPMILGISPKDITAKFVGLNPEEHTMTFRKLYYDPIYAIGVEQTVDYSRISHLREMSLANTGPR